MNDNNSIKHWIYPMFFLTKSGPGRILIVNSISIELKDINTIFTETQMSYHHVKYHVDLLEEKNFIIKINKKYIILEKFRENYNILTDITNQTNCDTY